MPVAVSIQYGIARKGLPHPSAIRAWVVTAVNSQRRFRGEVGVTVRFVGRREGRQLNRQWRGKDYATNVLSFSGDLSCPHGMWLGDIVICVPVIKSEAAGMGISTRSHCAHMVIHGVLHLLGHDHVRKREARIMEAIETRLLRQMKPGKDSDAAGARP